MSRCPNCGTAIPRDRVVARDDDRRSFAECPDCWEVHPVPSLRA